MVSKDRAFEKATSMRSRVSGMSWLAGILGCLGTLIGMAVVFFTPNTMIGVLIFGFSFLSIIGGAILEGLAEISIKIAARNVIDLE